MVGWLKCGWLMGFVLGGFYFILFRGCGCGCCCGIIDVVLMCAGLGWAAQRYSRYSKYIKRKRRYELSGILDLSRLS